MRFPKHCDNISQNANFFYQFSLKIVGGSPIVTRPRGNVTECSQLIGHSQKQKAWLRQRNSASATSTTPVFLRCMANLSCNSPNTADVVQLTKLLDQQHANSGHKKIHANFCYNSVKGERSSDWFHNKICLFLN